MRDFAQHMSVFLCRLNRDEVKNLSGPQVSPEVTAEIEALACKDEGAKRRLQELLEIIRRPAEGRELLLAPLGLLPGNEGRERLKSSAYEIKWMLRDKPHRKCARPECERVESSINEFLVCSGCRLACYCGRGESKITISD